MESWLEKEFLTDLVNPISSSNLIFLSNEENCEPNYNLNEVEESSNYFIPEVYHLKNNIINCKETSNYEYLFQNKGEEQKKEIIEEKNIISNCLKTKEIKEEEKKSTEDENSKMDKLSKSMFGKRGRKKIKEKENRKHTKYDKDNLLGKIQVHYITFLINYVNYQLKIYLPNLDLKFFDIIYSEKKNSSKKNVEKLKTMTIGEILKKPASNKNKKNIKDLDNHNEKVFDIVYNRSIEIKNILDKNYLDLFFLEYFTKFNESITPLERAEGIFKFNDLFLKEKEKNPDDVLYLEKMVKVAQKNFKKQGVPVFTTTLPID